ncbi:MAG TPA: 50S ribosomal protein L28 [Candidatus Sulfotelmatobacter sp.]|nr:50S ribosomal protein L28 [Candidatus Sulfotelmatobacter sp.]
MAMKCMYCGKGVMYGHNVSHSKRRTPRVFKPNLHSTRIQTTTGFVRLKLCTKCLRVIKKIKISESIEIPTETVPQVTA